MSNPNLVAKQIIDKNGKSTTVHISMGKLTEGQNTSGSSLYVPAAPPQLPSIPGVYAFSISTTRMERNVFLPHKRTGRDIHFTDLVIVDVPNLSPAEAPVNMKVGDSEYRSYDETLYKKIIDDQSKKPVEAEDLFSGTPSLRTDYAVNDRPDYDGLYQKHSNDFIVIDGEVWAKSNEPVYVIDTAHYLWGNTMEIVVTDDPSRERNENVFSANEREGALQRANELLDEMPQTSRGYSGEQSTYHYDHAAESIENLEEIDVLDASLIGSTYKFPARISYPNFSSYEEGDYDRLGVARTHIVSERMEKAMKSYRETFEKIPGALTVEASGAKKINWDLIPEGLKNNYMNASKWALENGYLP